MTNPTSNFGWQMPTNTDLVTDLPADFEVFGQAVDTTLADLKGGTSGQVLAKASATDMDFVWTTPEIGDITAITVTAPITGGGTSGSIGIGISAASTIASGAVQLTDSTASTSTTTAATPNSVKSAYDLANTANTTANSATTTANAAIPKSTVTTAGDIIYATGSGAVTRLGIGTTGQVLKVTAGIPSWGTASSSVTFSGVSLYQTTGQTISNATVSEVLYPNERYDTDGYHSTSTNTGRITIPAGKAGYYLVWSQINWQTNGSVSRRLLQINLNGTPITSVEASPAASTPLGYYSAQIAYANVGDYFNSNVYQNTGGSMNLENSSGGSCVYFGATYLGA